MANKVEHKVSSKQIFFFLGIGICAFSVILIMNIGYPARAITYLFSYLFGICSYLVYVLLYILGLYFLFKEKTFKIKPNNVFFGGIIVFISALMIASFVQNKDAVYAFKANEGVPSYKEFIDSFFNNIVENEEVVNYFNAKSYSVNMFKSFTLGGGIVGYFFFSLFVSFLSRGGAIAVSIVLAIIGLALCFLKVILKLVKKGVVINKEKAPKEKKIKKIKPVTAKEDELEIVNFDVISSASVSSVVTPINPSVQAKVEEESLKPTPLVSFGSTSTVNTGFRPAKFVRNGESNPPINIPLSTAPRNAFTPSIPSISKPLETIEPVIEEAEDMPRHEEQLTFDFDESAKKTEEQATVQPMVEEVRSVPRVEEEIKVEPTPAPIAQPVVENKPRERVKWVAPSNALLDELETSQAAEQNNATAEARVEKINEFFHDFKIGAQVVGYTVGPSVTRYNISYNSDEGSRAIATKIDDLSIRLGGVDCRFEAIVKGQSFSGIEIPNCVITAVSFKDVYNALPDVKKHPLSIAFGKDVSGNVLCRDFDEFPHILISGTTGSGKSVFVNSIITTLIMRNSPDDLKIVLVDPKRVEMARYKDIPHLLCPIISEAPKAKRILDLLVDEMNDRYSKFEECMGATSIKEYNEDCENYGMSKIPYIIVILDEYADLVDNCKDIDMPVVQIAQKARACGIHIAICTQRPSTNVVTGTIKGNLPTHVALLCSSQIDSCTIIGEGGAEKLLGKGDMLVQSPIVSNTGVVRVQSCFIQRKEGLRVVGYLKEHYETSYDPKFLNLEDEATMAGDAYNNSPEFQNAKADSEEDKYQMIKEWVMSQNYMSISRIQRECQVGFNRAGRFFIRLQQEGVVGMETDGNKGCPVLKQNKFGDSPDTIVTSEDYTSLGYGK